MPPLHLLAKYDIEGELPATGGVVLAPNHYSDIDPIITGVVSWRRGRAPRYMAKASLFRIPVVGWFLRHSGQIPVERARGADRGRSMSAARKLAADKSLVIVYPEGTLTRDPDMWPMRGKSGAVRLALESGLPLIPMATWGAHHILPRFSKKLRFTWRTRIRAKIGEPLDLSAYQGKHHSRTAVEAATRELMDAITALLEDLRGAHAPAERYDPAAHGETEYGLPKALQEQQDARRSGRA